MPRYLEIDLIIKLQEATKLLGHPPSKSEMDDLDGFPSRSVYQQRFGSWKKAFNAANLPCDHFLKHGGIASGKKSGWGKDRRIIISPENRRVGHLKLRFSILKRDNFTCQYCGATPKDGAKLAIDHIVPFSKGGKTEESNLITSCFNCNAGKRDSLIYLPIK